ncbi:5,10-methenyltetrahydrofolate synthetase [Synechococcus sp. PCC 7335]|uniref:5-formyltetrahydrofolate cyclo-ligase n=1 Tax=Synechococcus sp. (strain ATCC 29403 / PCC 7335) TaxID=91464 RepID=UPI00017EE465|nr:5-formyltetrahydrofolate cyclo-ligase [Synechococcus sp. PCC 7335]EDX87249.1 5,10-methenyltetrahydrofolate synthetase [Synechococcus sp. PCC 7335]
MSFTSDMGDKESQRRSLLKARQAMPQRIRAEKSARICQHIQNWAVFGQSRLTLAYCTSNAEPDLSLLLQQPRSWGLPRCEGKTLTWHQWYPDSPWALRPGVYGITEPDPDSPLVDPDKVDLILVPCIACDVSGYRLGYGGGYYDRMFSNSIWADKPTIGVVFEYARVPQLPRDIWDIPLDGICTESGFFFRR